MLCASSPLAFQESTCMSFQQENFISQPRYHQSSCHVGQTQTEPPRKSSLVQIFNKEQLSHWVSAAGSITLKRSTQFTSAIRLRKNIPFLFSNVFFVILWFKKKEKQKWYNDKSCKNIKSEDLQTVWEEVDIKVKSCTAPSVKLTENFCGFSVISSHHTAPSATLCIVSVRVFLFWMSGRAFRVCVAWLVWLI